MPVEIRPAAECDASSILGILDYYIGNTEVNFDFEPPSLETFRQNAFGAPSPYPFLVCTIDGEIAGYASAGEQFRKAAYRWNAELSVYLRRESTGRGIGTALYNAVIEILKLQGVQNIYGKVASPNPGSEKLHARFGFTLAGTLHRTGFKHGKWHDVLIYEKHIGERDSSPAQIIPFPQLDDEQVAKILKKSERLVRL